MIIGNIAYSRQPLYLLSPLLKGLLNVSFHQMNMLILESWILQWFVIYFFIYLLLILDLKFKDARLFVWSDL